MKSVLSPPGLGRLIQQYRQHLSNAVGLAVQTCAQRVRYVRRFLQTGLAGGSSQWRFRQLRAPQLVEYLTSLSVKCHPSTLRCHAGALRSFFRFLTLAGRAPAGLDAALPLIRPGRRALPVGLSPPQLNQLLSAWERQSPAGVRAHAAVLLAARLGLRAREIAQLRLEDLDWEAGTVCLRQTKGLRSRLLPLPEDVAQALVLYLRTVRPRVAAREVFLGLHRPSALTAGAVSDLTVAAFARAGLKVQRPGPHLLRHTLATHLIQRGTSLKAIADLLGHRSLNTTTIYARVNVPMLRQIAQPWPGDQP